MGLAKRENGCWWVDWPNSYQRSFRRNWSKGFRNNKFKLVSKKDVNILNLQEEIEQKTGLNVSINNKKNNSGSVSFYYQTIDQLDKIIEVIKKNY